MSKAIADIRGMDTAELQAKLQDLHKEQFGLKFRGAPEQVAKTSRHRDIRRTIARILLVLGERASGAAAAVHTAAAAEPRRKKPVTAKAKPAGSAKAGKQ
jgi:large subunit ribosomal protein L29